MGKGFDLSMKNKRAYTIILGLLCAVTAASCSGSNEVNSYTMGTVGETASATMSETAAQALITDAASLAESVSQTTADETTEKTTSETEVITETLSETESETTASSEQAEITTITAEQSVISETTTATAQVTTAETTQATTTTTTTTQATTTEPAPAKETVLVAYFSNPQTDATDADTSASRNLESGSLKGNVQYAAELIQAKVGGDIFRIETVEPYPAAYDPTINQALEEQRANARPELKNSIDISGYDTIYLGYPNWWGDLPMVLYTFLEQYDLSGKTVNVFVCHGGSRASSTLSTIKSLQPGANISDNVLTLYWTDIPEAPAKVNEWIG